MPLQPAANCLLNSCSLAVVQKVVARLGKIVDFTLGKPTGKLHSASRIDNNIGRGVEHQNWQLQPVGLFKAAPAAAHQLRRKPGPGNTTHVRICSQGCLLLR